ncbi:MAG TPA: ATP synthase F0 subunit B [Thermoanaerobaculia bacterium]|nr:ATP synthase F0 subunit B [Thermoanaerobaculia bacterium]
MTLGTAVLFLEEGQETARGFLGVPGPVWQLLNLGLFLGLLWYFLRKPAADFFGKRKAEVAQVLAKADEDLRRAEQLSAELKSRLATIETELANLKEAARREAGAEGAALLAKTQSDADQILARTRADLDNRVRSARAELTAFAGDLSVDLARELLQKSVTAEDEKRLLQEGIAHLSGAARDRGGAR